MCHVLDVPVLPGKNTSRNPSTGNFRRVSSNSICGSSQENESTFIKLTFNPLKLDNPKEEMSSSKGQDQPAMLVSRVFFLWVIWLKRPNLIHIHRSTYIWVDENNISWMEGLTSFSIQIWWLPYFHVNYIIYMLVDVHISFKHSKSTDSMTSMTIKLAYTFATTYFTGWVKKTPSSRAPKK